MLILEEGQLYLEVGHNRGIMEALIRLLGNGDVRLRFEAQAGSVNTARRLLWLLHLTFSSLSLCLSLSLSLRFSLRFSLILLLFH